MIVRYLLLTATIALLFTACGEPRRTPDGHLMDRPKMSAYGPDDITRHNTDESAESED